MQLADETGSITVVWFGRRQLAGVRPGTVMTVTGTPGRHHAMTAILNPEYEIISSPAAPEAPAEHH
jgi:RecG-like helicase